MFSKCPSGKELSFSHVNWKSLSDPVGLGEGPSICISDKLPRVAGGVGRLTVSGKEDHFNKEVSRKSSNK